MCSASADSPSHGQTSTHPHNTFLTLLMSCNKPPMTITSKAFIPTWHQHMCATATQERPDAILPTMGGQTALNLAKGLSEVGNVIQFTPSSRSVNSLLGLELSCSLFVTLMMQSLPHNCNHACTAHGMALKHARMCAPMVIPPAEGYPREVWRGADWGQAALHRPCGGP